MQHKGEIIEKAVRSSGISNTRFAEKMGKSRRWHYQIFDNSNVPLDYIIEIEKVIHYDFSNEIKELKIYRIRAKQEVISEASPTFDSATKEAEFWKNKYLMLLEKYSNMLDKDRDA